MIQRKDDTSTAAAREWQSIERLKREMRGIPALKAMSAGELASIRRAKARALNDAPVIDAEEVSKESLSTDPVPAPPPPEPPRGGGDLDKSHLTEHT